MIETLQELKQNKSVVLIMIIFFVNHLNYRIYGVLPLDYVLMALILAYLAAFKRKHIYISFFNKNEMFLVAFIALSMLSTIWSIFPLKSFEYSIRFVLLVALFILAKQIRKKSTLIVLLKAILLILFLNTAYSLLAINFGDVVYYGRFMFIGLSGTDPNYTAYALVFGIMFSFFISLEEKKIFYTFLGLFFLICTLYTYSRGILLSLVLSLLVAFCYFARRIKIQKKHCRIYLSIIFLGFGISILLINIFDVTYFKSLLRVGTILTGGGRIDLWKNALLVFISNPILGIGLGTFKYANISKFGIPLIRQNVTHNTFIELAVGGGIVVILPFVVYILEHLTLLLKKNEIYDFDFRSRNLLILLLLFNIFSMQTLNLETSRYFWLLMGLISALNLKTKLEVT